MTTKKAEKNRLHKLFAIRIDEKNNKKLGAQCTHGTINEERKKPNIHHSNKEEIFKINGKQKANIKTV